MSAYAPTTDRRGFLKLTILGVGGAILLRALSVPELGEVVTGEHAVQRHDLDALTVRRWFVEHAAEVSLLFQQPPCKDGRYRYAMAMGNGAWAVWVLDRLGATLYQEVTAFATRNRDYIDAMRDDCGNSGWQGHDMMTAKGRKGDGIETTAA